MLDSVIKVNKKYYPQTFLEECKYEIKKNKMENRVNEDFEPSSSDDSELDNDESKKSSKNLTMILIMNLTMNDLLMNLGIKNALLGFYLRHTRRGKCMDLIMYN